MHFNFKQIFSKHKLSFEETIFQSVTSLAALFTFYYVFHGYMIGLNIEIRLVTFVAFFGYCVFFFFSRKQGYFKFLVIPFILFTNLVIGFAWFFNGGSEGAMPFLYQLGFVSFIMITQSRYHTFIFLLILGNLLLVSGLEFLYPELLAEHPSDITRKTDVFIGNFLSILFIGLLLNMLKKNYVREKELVNQQKQELEAAYHTKSRFLANMSHEIRTPMNGMLGMATILAHTELTNQQKEYLSAIEVSGDRLMNVINEILDYSKIEAGEMKLKEEHFSLYQCMSEVLDITAPRAYAKDLELACVFRKNVPKQVIGDFSKLRQILLNIIGNALKFTEEGEIFVEVQMLHQVNNKVTLQFAIKDTGIGIAAADQANLFQSFTQVDDSNKRVYGGTGLGLAICKEFIEMMQGKIWLESEQGKGSTFYFSILVEYSEKKEVPAYKIPEEKLYLVKDKKVLLVEDNATNRALMKKGMEAWGMQVAAAENAQEALTLIKKEGAAFDLALIDYRIEGMNGFDLGKRILEKGYEFPLFLLGAHDKLDMLEVSKLFRLVLQKPLKAHLIFESFVQLFEATKKEKTVHLISPKINTSIADGSPLDILVVEDDLVNQKLSLSLLGLMGYSPDLAENGEKAVQMLCNKEYDVVLMDIQLPQMDGFQTTKSIRQLPLDKQPIIVAMTANVFEEDQYKCVEAGMNHFIKKPINIPKLEGLLQGIV